MRDHLGLIATLVTCLSCACAAPETDDVQVNLVTAALSGSCEWNSNNNGSFPAGADAVVIRLTGGELTEPFIKRIANDDTSVHVVTGITPGDDMTLEVVGCAGSDALWAGLTLNVNVRKQEKSFPPVFLTPLGSQTVCVSEDPALGTLTHAFGAGVRIDDQVFVIGGANSYNPSGRNAFAGKQVSAYNRYTGLIAPTAKTASLIDSRLMAHAWATDDGQIRLAGGASELKFRADNNFDLWTPGTAAPACAIERYDPTNDTSTCETQATVPAGASVARLANDTIVLVGGVNPGDEPSKALWVFAKSGHQEHTMPEARVGATVVPLNDTHILVWGGNTSGGAAKTGLIVNVTNGTMAPADVGGYSAVPIWAAGAPGGSVSDDIHRVIIAGGTELTSSTDDIHAALPPAGPRLDLLTVVLSTSTVTVTPIDAGADSTQRFTRAGGSLVALADGSLWFLGGIALFTKYLEVCPDDSNRCFPTTMTRFEVDYSSGSPVFSDLTGASPSLSVGALGAIPVDLGDGSQMILAGFTELSSTGLGVGGELVRYDSASAALCTEAP